MKKLLLGLVFLITACTSVQAVSTSQPAMISVFYSPYAETYLTKLFKCANAANVVINLAATEPDIYLQLGEPQDADLPVVQIGADVIQVVVGSESTMRELSEADAQAVFAGVDESAQVWGYESAADVQRVFEQLVMKERSVSSRLHTALNPGQMIEQLNSDPLAVGILPHSWLNDSLRVVYSAGEVPVLALIRNVPDEIRMRQTLACMQKN